MICFIVLFTLKTRSEENIAYVQQCIMQLEESINVLKSMEIGTNLHLTNRSSDIVAIFNFETIEDLHLFEDDAEHIRIVELIKPFVAEIKTVIYKKITNKDHI